MKRKFLFPGSENDNQGGNADGNNTSPDAMGTGETSIQSEDNEKKQEGNPADGNDALLADSQRTSTLTFLEANYLQRLPEGETLGSMLINPSFNPGKDGRVAEIKRLCAELIDTVNKMGIDDSRDKAPMAKSQMVEGVDNILTAQMNIVKALTA